MKQVVSKIAQRATSGILAIALTTGLAYAVFAGASGAQRVGTAELVPDLTNSSSENGTEADRQRFLTRPLGKNVGTRRSVRQFSRRAFGLDVRPAVGGGEVPNPYYNGLVESLRSYQHASWITNITPSYWLDGMWARSYGLSRGGGQRTGLYPVPIFGFSGRGGGGGQVVGGNVLLHFGSALGQGGTPGGKPDSGGPGVVLCTEHGTESRPDSCTDIDNSVLPDLEATNGPDSDRPTGSSGSGNNGSGGSTSGQGGGVPPGGPFVVNPAMYLLGEGYRGDEPRIGDQRVEVPEPASYGLFLTGALCMGAFVLLRRKSGIVKLTRIRLSS